MEKGDKGSTMIRMGVSGWMFLLVPAYLGCPGSKPLNGRCCCCCQLPRQRPRTLQPMVATVAIAGQHSTHLLSMHIVQLPTSKGRVRVRYLTQGRNIHPLTPILVNDSLFIYIAAGHHIWRSFPYPPPGDAAGSLQQGPNVLSLHETGFIWKRVCASCNHIISPWNEFQQRVVLLVSFRTMNLACTTFGFCLTGIPF